MSTSTTLNGKVLRTALSLMERGFWPIAVYPPGVTIRGRTEPTKGKEPLGQAWGLEQWDKTKLERAHNSHHGAGVGLVLGPGRAPGGRWLIDVEGDGPAAEESLSTLFGGELVESMGWTSRRGRHLLLAIDRERLDPILGRLSKCEAKGEGKPGVYKLAGLPDLELRIGGFKPDGTAKQLQSVCPPTAGEDGLPRKWTGETLAEAPDAFYAALERLADEQQEASVKAERPTIRLRATSNKLARASAYLAKCDKAVSGERGHDRLFRAAVMVGPGFDLTEAEALHLLKTEYSPRCDPVWSDADLEHKVEDAYKNEPRRGWLLEDDRHQGNREAKGSGSFDSSSSEHVPTFGGSPRPIVTELKSVPAMVPVLLPSKLRDWLADIADRVGCPLDFVAVAAVTVLGAIVGRRLGIRPKRQDDWKVVPNMWGAIVAPPGYLKSPALHEVMSPVYRIANTVRQQHDEELASYQAKLLVAKTQAEAAKDALKAAAKAKKSQPELEKLASLAVAPEKIEPPAARRYVVNDPTVPKLAEILVDNPAGVLLFRDELMGWLSSLEQYGREGDRQFFIEAWNGNTRSGSDRIGRGTTDPEAICVSILGGIQPGPMFNLIRSLDGNRSKDDGLIQRFQLMTYPDLGGAWVNVDRWPDSEAKRQAFELFESLANLDAVSVGATHDDDDGVPFLRFDVEAQAFFDQWRFTLENRLRSGDDPTVIESHLSKYRSLMPSLALVFHLANQEGLEGCGAVSLHAASQAAAWCEYLEKHARRIYDAAIDDDPEPGRKLAERIKRGEVPSPFTIRAIWRHGWSGLSSVEAVERATATLETHGWVKPVERAPDPRGGRPTEDYHLHPDLPRKQGGES